MLLRERCAVAADRSPLSRECRVVGLAAGRTVEHIRVHGGLGVRKEGTNERLSPSMVVAIVALLVALSGTASRRRRCFRRTASVQGRLSTTRSGKSISGPRFHVDREADKVLRASRGKRGLSACKVKPRGAPGLAGLYRAHRAELNGSGNIRAFVPTDSTSPKCLVTLNESNNSAGPGATVYCGSRTYLGVEGVLISIFLPSPFPRMCCSP